MQVVHETEGSKLIAQSPLKPHPKKIQFASWEKNLGSEAFFIGGPERLKSVQMR